MDSGNVIVLLHIMIGKNMITIAFLAENLDTIPTLAKWFRSQWSDYLADVLQEGLEQGFLPDQLFLTKSTYE